MTIILFTNVAPHPLAAELARQGCQVYEALAVSEVLTLAEQHPTATILIAADVDPERAKAVQEHYPTLHLKPSATVRDILWEISHVTKAELQ